MSTVSARGRVGRRSIESGRAPAIVEEALLEVMYDIPERTDVKKVVITSETIEHGQPPMLLTENEHAEPRRRAKDRRAEPEEESA